MVRAGDARRSGARVTSRSGDEEETRHDARRVHPYAAAVSGYEPIKIISWQRAMTLLTLDKVDIVEEYNAEIRAMSMIVKVPASCGCARRSVATASR